MLSSTPMSRTALALVLVAASASSAFAGGFVGLGIGTGAATSGDFDIDEDGRSGRLMLGYRFGRISVEGMGTRYDMVTPDAHEWSITHSPPQRASSSSFIPTHRCAAANVSG